MAGVATDQRGPPAVSSGFERHVQTVLGLVVASLIGWVGMEVSESAEQIARLEERVGAMSAQISDVGDTRVALRALEVRVDALERHEGNR
ncbi:MAG: hypothetical protein OIF57_17420 [Marinobacterium sp.]|nr:hypothetical protein [Marinobacterium sp.]